MIHTIQKWHDMLAPNSMVCANGTSSLPPMQYQGKIIHDTFDLYIQQEEADVAMKQTQRALGANVLGWIPNDEFEATKEPAQDIEPKMLEAVETEHNITAVRDHVPFDDFDQNA